MTENASGSGFSSVLSLSRLAEGRTFVTVAVDGHGVRFRADSGADLSTILASTWNAVGSPALQRYVERCTQADGSGLHSMGYFTAVMSYDGLQCREPILVVKSGSTNLLCGRVLKRLQLLQWRAELDDACVASVSSPPSYISTLQARFPALFEKSLGCYDKLEVKLYVREDARSRSTFSRAQ